jgi:hypothetical protein
MRSLERLRKRAEDKAYKALDFQPWLTAINDTLATLTVGDAPDIVETYTTNGAVVELTFSAGDAGAIYRVPVTAVSARGLAKTVVIEVSIPGVLSNVSPSTGSSGAIGNLDGGGPGTIYDPTDAIDGGSP